MKLASSILYMSDIFGFEQFSESLSNPKDRWKMVSEMSETLVRYKGDDPNVDPVKRTQIEEFIKIAQLNISEVLELDVRSVTVALVTRTEYVKDAAASYKSYFDTLEIFGLDGAMLEIASDFPNETMEKIFGGDLGASIAPLLATSILSMCLANLAMEVTSSYGVIAPRTTNHNEVLLVANNIVDFKNQWSLDEDDFWMWLCLSQLSMHAVISIPHIQSEMLSLIQEFVGSFEPSGEMSIQRLQEGLTESFEEGDLESNDNLELGEFQVKVSLMEERLMSMFSNEPEILLGAQISEAQEIISEQLSSLVAVIRGVSQFVLDVVVKKVLGSNPKLDIIKEAALRHENVPSQPINMMSRLLGIDMSPELKTLGVDFVAGITEAGNPNAILSKLLDSVEHLPTPTELGMPKLWLARVGLKD